MDKISAMKAFKSLMIREPLVIIKNMASFKKTTMVMLKIILKNISNLNKKL